MATTTPSTHSISQYVLQELQPREMYKLLRYYYENNGLYDQLYDHLKSIEAETQGLRPLRNPANRVVEFYAAKLWPGNLPNALPIISENENLATAIHRIWSWSNWAAAKQIAARYFARDGDWFTKVVLRLKQDSVEPQSVYFQVIEAEYVSDLEQDERGYLTYVRLDVPQTRRTGDETVSYTYTEEWDKSTLTYRTWEHDKGVNVDIDALGTPKVEANYQEAFGIDFIPIVQAKFRDTGDTRGVGAFTHCLDKIDEANRVATRLHQLLWRHDNVTWALQANMVDAQGRPMPAPNIDKNSDDKIELGDEKLLRLPGNSSLTPLVPSLDYSAELAILQDMMAELERDLPELVYHRLSEAGDLSGRAVRYMLSEATDKLLEARGSAEAALVRLDQMALTIAQNARILSPSLGRYENGDFEHSFAERDVINVSAGEEAETVTGWVQTGLSLRSALRLIGWSDEEITAAEEEKAQEKANTMTPAEQILQGLETRG